MIQEQLSSLTLNRCEEIKQETKEQTQQKLTQQNILRQKLKLQDDKSLIMILNSEINHKLQSLLYWGILILKYPNINLKHGVEEYIKKNLGNLYLKLFTQIPIPKEESANLLVFFDIYICTSLYQKNFGKELIELQFIFDCFTQGIFLINGINVSLYYVQSQIFKLFTNQFYSYQERPVIKERQSKGALFSEKFTKLLSVDQELEKNNTNVQSQEKTEKLTIMGKKNPFKTRSGLQKKRSISERQNSVQIIKQKIFGNEVSPQMEIQSSQQKRSYNRRIQNLDDSKLIKMLNQYQYEKSKSFEKEDIYQIKRMKNQNDQLLRYKQYDLEPRQLIYDTKLQVNYMKEMRDMDYILQQKQETMQNLPSARKLLKTDTFKVSKKNQQEKQLILMLDREMRRNQSMKSGRNKLSPIQEKTQNVSFKQKINHKNNFSNDCSVEQKNKLVLKINSFLKQSNNQEEEFLNTIRNDIDLILENDLLQ